MQLLSEATEVKASQPIVGGFIDENQTFNSTESTYFNWDYDVKHATLRRLYEKGKSSQWNVSTDLDWSIDVDLEKQIFEPDPAIEAEDWYKKMTKREKNQFVVESNTNSLSQFLHGEQGALIATSQLVTAVPDADAKFYAATQVVDEARHVEAFDRYLREKMGEPYHITENLFFLLKDISTESRWDFKFLGMQLLVEGLALAAFMNMFRQCNEPLLKQLIRYVLQDESRHVAYGVLSLKNYYDDMEEKELRERQEFVYESTLKMRDRFFSTQAGERIGIDRKLLIEFFTRSKGIQNFRSLMFVNVVPNMKKIGLLRGFLKEKYAEMGILHLQDFDTEGLLNSFIDGQGDPGANIHQQAPQKA